MRSGVTSPRVTDRLGGRGGKSRKANSTRSGNPGVSSGLHSAVNRSSELQVYESCACQVTNIGEETETKEWVCRPCYTVTSKSRAALLCKVLLISLMLLTSYVKGTG